MARKKRESRLAHTPDNSRQLGNVAANAESALVDLDGALTAARALVDLTLADGGAEEGPVLYKRLNALEFLLRKAGQSEDIIWVSLDQMRMSLEEALPTHS